MDKAIGCGPNVPEWRGTTMPHGDAFLNWRVVMEAAAAAAAVG